ncbi:MAG: DUF3833 domain-containing protein [Desulfovibrionales bacterium]|nr:DUF3833 domain-containing protein [Desulfovibrionales bacterium]
MAEYFILEDFLNGTLDCHGVIIRRNGDIRHRFTAELTGTWQTEPDGMYRGTLHEIFTFDSGETHEREWRFTKEASHGYIATAADVQGLANITIRGFEAIAMYRLSIPFAKQHLIVDVEDMLWISPKGVVLGKAIMRKFGVRFGEMITVMIPRKK